LVYLKNMNNPPLAFRRRPTQLIDVLGQKHIVGPDGFLTKCLERRTLVSVILFGPPGSGKTTIAEAFAHSMDLHAIKLNAVTASKKEIELAMDEARLFHPCIMIIDEVHRLPKDKQDLLLAAIEDGSIYLFGATTENPYMALNPAIRSRCHLLEVMPLNSDDILLGLHKAMLDTLVNPHNASVTSDGLLAIAKLAGGDLRFAYNALEIVLITHQKDLITFEDVQATLKVPPSIIDEDGGGHYDAISALQKSIRGSDVNAALYYLARLIVAGDMESLRRRLLVTAYEDIGLANPNAVMRTVQAIDVAKMVGFPEARIPLAFCVIDLALSPKTKVTVESIDAALAAVGDHPEDVLDYLKLTPVNHKDEDKYPYDRPDLWDKMQYLPHSLKDKTFFNIEEKGAYLRQLNDNYRQLMKIRRRADLAKLKKE